jgi:glycogen debranching enzyme
VQAYVYAAKRGAAALCDVMAEPERAGALRAQAETLRQRFEREFWCEELGTYALALDADKRPCRVRASNAGQCLASRITSPERAHSHGRRLVLRLGRANARLDGAALRPDVVSQRLRLAARQLARR